jgi:hypothetical protein
MQGWLSFGCFICAVIQTIQGWDAWQVRRTRTIEKAATQQPDKLHLDWARPLFWILAPVLTAVVGTVILMYHPQPQTVVKTVTVEKTVPCPPTKSGAATTRGAQAPAITGNGNPVSYGQSLPPKQ